MRFVTKPRWALLLVVPLTLVGCKQVGSLLVLFSPPQIQKPEFELTTGRLAIVTDYARPAQTNPVFDLNLYNRIFAQFRENEVPCQIVPYGDVVRLRQSNPEFAKWSVQEIGRRLNAEQVLYLRIEQFQLLRSPRDPIITPRVALRVKVVGVHEPSVHARLWPERDADPDGRTVTHTRPPKEAGDFELSDAETAKLARETAHFVARFFHKYDLEVKPPHEP